MDHSAENAQPLQLLSSNVLAGVLAGDVNTARCLAELPLLLTLTAHER